MKFEEYLASLQRKTVAVIGIGVSNRPLIELLLSRGVAVTAYDKKDRAALEDPEASWDLADLIASGKTFPYNWFGETRYHIPDNSFLTGFKAIQHLRSSYYFLGGFYQAAWKDTAGEAKV